MREIQQIVPNHCKMLPDDATLWRYVSLNTLFFYLNGNIFLPSIARLRSDDPFEGEYRGGFLANFNSAFQARYGVKEHSLQKWLHDNLCSDADKEQITLNGWNSDGAADVFKRYYFEFLRRTRFVWCWFSSELESAAMWRTYGNGGVAIGTDVGKLKKVLHGTGRDFLFSQMRYVPSRGSSPIQSNDLWKTPEHYLLRPFFFKRVEYEHEKEVRFVTTGPECEDVGGFSMRNVRPAEWITKVRFWPKLTRSEEESLTKTIHCFIERLDCRCSDLFGRHWAGEDTFEAFMEEHNEEADSRWRKCLDGTPPEIKEL